MPTVELLEWQQATPQSHPMLRNLDLGLTTQERALLARLDSQPMVSVQEVRDGVGIRATSYVGSLRAGPLTIQITPKLKGRFFSALLAYAVGLPVSLLPEHEVVLTTSAFQDLIVSRLASEASRLLARGIYRSYVPRQASLSSPHGRILFSCLAREPLTTAKLPCRFEERHENVLPNRVLLTGLVLARRLAVESEVQARISRLVATLTDRVQPVPLSEETFRALLREGNRLTTAYEPAVALIRLLVAGAGIGLDAGAERAELPGFLFDMNRLFQDVLERFLREWLEDSIVMSQHRLQDMFRYDPAYNPRRRRSPTLRPDYVLRRKGRVVAIIDAKYRDLWEQSLPPSILYQLSVYALSQSDCQTAVILYATNTAAAREARIEISDPVRGGTRAWVLLRPVCLPELADLIRQKRTVTDDRRRHEYAAYLAYGVQARSKLVGSCQGARRMGDRAPHLGRSGRIRADDGDLSLPAEGAGRPPIGQC